MSIISTCSAVADRSAGNGAELDFIRSTARDSWHWMRLPTLLAEAD